MSTSLIHLRQFIVDHYGLEELRALCFDLDVGYGDLGGKEPSRQARELILRLGRQGQLDLLLGALEREHPDSFVRRGFSADPATLEPLYAALPSFDAPYTLAGGTLPAPLATWPVAPPDPFLGRARERDELSRALRDEHGSVHTLLGIGGVGKTALAARVVRDLIEDDVFPGGVLWFSLEAVHSVDTLWVQIGAAYGYPPAANAARVARAALDQHRPLLVLTNAESAPHIVYDLLEDRGAATVLLTTHSRDVVAGWHGPPRQIDPPDRPDAIKLFRARAGGDPALVDELCELVGDLPLAIILAAGHVVGDREPLRNYLDMLRFTVLKNPLPLAERREMSVLMVHYRVWECLDDDGRLALSALALDGGETSALDAVAAGAGWVDDSARARRACDDLVRRSLAAMDVVRGNRYRLHPQVRYYTVELPRIDAAGHAGVRTRLSAHYLAYARAHKQPTAAGYDALHAEHVNILAAMNHASWQKQWAQVRRFAWALCKPTGGYLIARGYWTECYTRLRQAIHAAKAEGNERETAALSHNMAALAQDMGRMNEARRLCRSSLAIYKTLGERPAVAALLYRLGTLAQTAGDHTKARRLYFASMRLREELGEQAGVADTLDNLGRMAQVTGDYVQAHSLCTASLNIKTELGDQPGIAITLHEMGNLACLVGDHAEARGLYQRSMDIQETLGNRAGVALALGELANLACEEGEQDEAEAYYRKAIALHKELDDVAGMGIVVFNLALLYEDQRSLKKALSVLKWAREILECVESPYAERVAHAIERVQFEIFAAVLLSTKGLREH